jgi:hypothetical protein
MSWCQANRALICKMYADKKLSRFVAYNYLSIFNEKSYLKTREGTLR